MDDPGWWCWIIGPASALLTAFFSLIYLSLRHISWVKLEESLTARGRADYIQTIHHRYMPLIYCMTALRLLANLTLMLCVIMAMVSHNGPSQEDSMWLIWGKAFGFSAVILLVFSIAVPQAVAKYAGTAVLVYTYPVIRILDTLFRPVTFVLHLFDPLIKRLAGIQPEQGNGRMEDRQDELLSMVEKQTKEGVVDDQEREMIESILEFRDSTIGEIMTPRTDVFGIEVNTELNKALEIIVERGYSRFPVYEGSIDKIIGMLYAKDLLKHFFHPDEDTGIHHRLRKPYFVPENKSVRDLLHDFQNQKVHMAVVLDEYGGTAGIVTIEDILEELVGEIVDEYESPQAEPLIKVSDNSYEVDARYHVDELNDELELGIPEDEDYETIGGFAFSKLGSIPIRGETFEHGRLHFTVIEVEQRKINRLRIQIMLPDADEDQ